MGIVILCAVCLLIGCTIGVAYMCFCISAGQADRAMEKESNIHMKKVAAEIAVTSEAYDHNQYRAYEDLPTHEPIRKIDKIKKLK